MCLPNVSRTSEQSKEGAKDSLQILQGAPLLRLAGCGQLVFVQFPDGDGSKATHDGKDGAGEKLNEKITSSTISAKRRNAGAPSRYGTPSLGSTYPAPPSIVIYLKASRFRF